MSSKQPTPLEERLGKIAPPYDYDLTRRVDEEESKEVCKWHDDNIGRGGVCKRHAPIVVPNPRCDVTPETLQNHNYTDGNVVLTRYPDALCPCGDYKDRRKPRLLKEPNAPEVVGSMCQMCGGSTGYEKAMLCDKCRERGPRL